MELINFVPCFALISLCVNTEEQVVSGIILEYYITLEATDGDNWHEGKVWLMNSTEVQDFKFVCDADVLEEGFSS